MDIDEALKDIATQIEKVIDFIATGDITKGAATKKITNLQKQKAKLSKERQELDVEQSLLLREVFMMEKIKETRLWWLEYSEKLKEKDKRKLVDALVEKINISPRKYSKKQAQKDDEYDGPDVGLEAKFNIEIIGRIPINGFTKKWEELKSGLLGHNLKQTFTPNRFELCLMRRK